MDIVKSLKMYSFLDNITFKWGLHYKLDIVSIHIGLYIYIYLFIYIYIYIYIYIFIYIYIYIFIYIYIYIYIYICLFIYIFIYLSIRIINYKFDNIMISYSISQLSGVDMLL